MSQPAIKKPTTNQRIAQIKKVMISLVKTIHDVVVETTKESDIYHKRLYHEFTKLEHQIRKI